MLLIEATRTCIQLDLNSGCVPTSGKSLLAFFFRSLNMMSNESVVRLRCCALGPRESRRKETERIQEKRTAYQRSTRKRNARRLGTVWVKVCNEPEAKQGTRPRQNELMWTKRRVDHCGVTHGHKCDHKVMRNKRSPNTKKETILTILYYSR
jgi:hypothetical protein